METQKKILEQDPKILYYMSMEFLMGRALGNNLINLSIYNDFKNVLDELGIDLNTIEEQEPDAALGTGGLGRLASCFLDSLSTLNYVVYGCGIRYRYGQFRQKIENGYQIEYPDDWLKNGNPFEIKRPEYAKIIKFGGYVKTYFNSNGKMLFSHEGYQAIKAVPYDFPVLGYKNNIVNTLRIWDAEPINSFSLDTFDIGNYQKALEEENLAKTIVEVLYPNDNHYAGKELRLKQQYFFVSASVQEAIEKYLRHHDDIYKISDKVCFQLNDTHPTIAIPELMRILIDEYSLPWDDAWKITIKTCAYTNHTIMNEALEKWPIDLFCKLLPRIYQIIAEIDRRFLKELSNEYPTMYEEKCEKMSIIYDGQIRMANLAIISSYSVNGVAKLHTEILKKEQLKDFYELMPLKFNNKTNGVTQRRFLLHANPLLSLWISRLIGNDWITDLKKLSKLENYATDLKHQQDFLYIKYQNKVRLSQYILKHNNISVDPNSIFDVQAKRLHEYKRQLMNILHIIYLYDKLKENPTMDFYPHTYIFAAKAAKAYKNAKLIIKLINSVAEKINNDSSINGKIKIIFIKNFSVSNAEIIYAAADISEQISTASKEASGTGNMKFMLNGAVTLGTLDGANVEIIEEVGKENAVIFGMTSKEIIDFENSNTYHPYTLYDSNPDIKSTVDHLIDGTFNENKNLFRDLYDVLLTSDPYFVLGDFDSYVKACNKIEQMYRDSSKWAKISILNIAHSGKFSSDRTIQEYVDDIWHLDKLL